MCLTHWWNHLSSFHSHFVRLLGFSLSSRSPFRFWTTRNCLFLDSCQVFSWGWLKLAEASRILYCITVLSSKFKGLFFRRLLIHSFIRRFLLIRDRKRGVGGLPRHWFAVKVFFLTSSRADLLPQMKHSWITQQGRTLIRFYFGPEFRYTFFLGRHFFQSREGRILAPN